MSRVEVAAAIGAELGESPVWDEQRQLLHFIDIFARQIHQFNPHDGAISSISVDGTPGALALREDGGYLAGIGLGIATVGADGSIEPIVRATRGDRLNDGKCDPRGRFLSGTMDGHETPGAAALYQLGLDGSLSVLLTDLALSNGMDWSPTGDRFYHVDTTSEQVRVFDYDVDTGRLGEPRRFVSLSESPGRPDGLTVDAEGGVWVAVPRAGAVRRYDAAGKLDETIELPTRMVTSCAFGGTDVDQLYVTSSSTLLPEAEREKDPVAGALFVVEGLGVRGKLPFRFSGTVGASDRSEP